MDREITSLVVKYVECLEDLLDKGGNQPKKRKIEELEKRILTLIDELEEDELPDTDED